METAGHWAVPSPAPGVRRVDLWASPSPPERQVQPPTLRVLRAPPAARCFTSASPLRSSRLQRLAKDRPFPSGACRGKLVG